MNSVRTLRIAPLAIVIGATLMVSGCNSTKTGASATAADSAVAGASLAASAAADPTASVIDSAAAPADSTAPAGSAAAAQAAPVKATGGGKFCAELAKSINTTPAATSDADPKTQILAARAATDKIVADAPSAIKSDVEVLVKASDVMYDALAKVNYDYSKLTAADTAGLSAPDVMAAEQHLTAYVKGTCGIDLGAGGAAAASAAAAGAAGAADTDSAAAGSDVSASGSACDLGTVAEVSAGAGKPMKLTGGAGTICAYGGVDDPSFFMYVQVYNDQTSMATPLGIESGSDHIADLGDDAFFNKTTGIVFVRKGSRGFSFTLPSLNNLTTSPDAIEANMVTLAKAAAGRF